MYNEFWIFSSSSGLNKIILTYQEAREQGNKMSIMSSKERIRYNFAFF